MNTKNMKIYCVYEHLDDTNKVFYVGIGSIQRSVNFAQRSNYWKRYVEKHCILKKPQSIIIHKNLDWDAAQKHEKFWISIYGRTNNRTGILVNLTDGGEGGCGLVHTDDAKRRIRESSIGRNKGINCKQSTRKLLSGKRKRTMSKEEISQKIKLGIKLSAKSQARAYRSVMSRYNQKENIKKFYLQTGMFPKFNKQQTDEGYLHKYLLLYCNKLSFCYDSHFDEWARGNGYGEEREKLV